MFFDIVDTFLSKSDEKYAVKVYIITIGWLQHFGLLVGYMSWGMVGDEREGVFFSLVEQFSYSVRFTIWDLFGCWNEGNF